MRVVSGFARGHKLCSLEGDSMRPTSDRAKEAIFSALGSKVLGSYFLDMFSGSGAIGIEALSRGAEFVAFSELSSLHADIIKKNLAHVSKAIPGPNYKIFNEDAVSALNAIKASSLSFDIIFMDPPYKSDLWEPALKQIYEMGLLNDNAVVVLEVSKDEKEPDSPYFNIIKSKSYGQAAVYYMESN